MTFEEVLPALKQGKKIRKLSWVKDGYPNAHLYIDPKKLNPDSPESGLTFIFDPKLPYTTIEKYQLNICQLLDDDWEIGGYKFPTKENLRESKIDRLLQ